MTSTLQLSIRWNDEFLRWNHSSYSNSISFRSNEIWVPDIITANNVNNFKYDSSDRYLIGNSHNIYDFAERNKYFILVNSSGDCRWVFPIKLLSICELNQDYFPFDVQECSIDFRSSAFVNDQLVLKIFGEGVHLKLINEGEFDLVKAEASEIDQKSSFNVDIDAETSVVRVKLLMKRKMVFYLNKIILPYFVFYIVVIFTYVLPIESGEKNSYSTSILISAMIYLKDTSNFIPKTSIIPMLSIYFNLNMVFIFLCIIITTFIYMVYYCDKTQRPLPYLFKLMVENNKYFADEQKLRQASIKVEIKNELDEVKNELDNLNKSLLMNEESRETQSIKSKPKALDEHNRIENFLASDVLNLLKTLKVFILDENETAKNKSRGTFTSRNKTNFHSINALENLKIKIINNQRNGFQRIPRSDKKFSSQNHLNEGLLSSMRNSYEKENLNLNKKKRIIKAAFLVINTKSISKIVRKCPKQIAI